MNNNMQFVVVSSGITYHTWDDLKLIRVSKEIEPPTIKKTSVSIEGMDGEYDLSEFFGEVKYENRNLRFSFMCKESFVEFDSIYTKILNSVHGEKVKVILPEDSNYYYIGRCEVNTWKTDKTLGSIVIDVNTEPYKLKNNVTVATFDLTSTVQTITLSNDRKSVIPEITCTGETFLEFNGDVYNLSAGTHILPDVVLKEGENIIKLKNTNNLIPYPYYDTTQTDNGITFTDNGDGTVTANGTATGEAVFYCNYATTTIALTENELYTFSGCPDGGSQTSYRIELVSYDGKWKFGYGSTIGVPKTITAQNNDTRVLNVFMRIIIASGATVENLTFKPLLQRADDTITFTYQEGAL